MTNEFSVWLFLADGTHLAERQWLEGRDAVDLAKACTERPAAKAGIIQKIIITDGGDFCVFEWQFGKGVTYPPKGEDGKFYCPPEDENDPQ